MMATIMVSDCPFSSTALITPPTKFSRAGEVDIWFGQWIQTALVRVESE
jgi:hypothetical protein